MARMPNKTRTVERMARMYRRFLWLYPADHRRDYGGLMMQLFRDQCREALREQGAPRLFAVGWRALTDLIFSSIHEHITNLANHMKTSGINLLSHLLIATAIGTAFLANPGIVGAGPAVACVALSMLALFARAIVEWFRPARRSMEGDWLGSADPRRLRPDHARLGQASCHRCQCLPGADHVSGQPNFPEHDGPHPEGGTRTAAARCVG